MKRYKGVPHAFAHYNHPERGLSQSFAYIEDTSEILRDVYYGAKISSWDEWLVDANFGSSKRSDCRAPYISGDFSS